MIKLNIHEAKTHLPEYPAKLKQRETIVLCKRNRPITEIRPIPALPAALGWSREGYLRGPVAEVPLPQSIIEDFGGAQT